MTEQQNDSSVTSNPSQPFISASTAGGMLLNARRAAGLSVDDVVAKLKLSRRQVEALEADRYGDLPGNTFVRGFVRNYARLLKLDPQPMLSYLEQHLPSEAPQSALPKLSDDSMPLMRPGGRPGGGLFSKAIFAALILVLLLLAAYWLYQRGLTEPGLLMSHANTSEAGKDASALAPGGPVPTPVEGERAMPPAEPGMPPGAAPVPEDNPAAPAPAVSAPVATAPAAAKPQALPTPVSPPPSAAPAPAAVAKPLPVPAKPAVVATPPAPAPAPAPSVSTATPPASPSAAAPTASPDTPEALKLIAHEESWMTVTDATGKRLISGLVKAGESRALSGTPPYKVRVGNAQHVEIIYKGKTSNLKPFTKSDVATLVLN